METATEQREGPDRSPSNVDHGDDPSEHLTAAVEAPLSRLERWNLLFCLLSWACTTAAATLVVGSSNLILVYIGAPESHSALALGLFFVGASIVSIIVPFITSAKHCFLTGTSFGIVGAFLFGVLSIYLKSEAVFLLASCAFGMAMGMGFHLRFAALGVVTGAHHKSFAMTLVVSGGCLAAFAGPEAAQGTIDMIEQYPYMGTMIMTGIYHLLNAVFLLLVQFPDTVMVAAATKEASKGDAEEATLSKPALYRLLVTRAFVLPMLLSACSWATMAMPMGIVRIAMASVGYTSRESLWVMELHFLGMYLPGFVTGKWIQARGYKFMCSLGCFVFGVAMVLLQVVRVVDHFALWALGMILIGIGWNFVFTSSTVWLTKGNLQESYSMSSVQAMHDFFMFLLSGIFILSASFIYAAGGQQLSGWGVLLWVVLGIWGFMSSLLVFDAVYPASSATNAVLCHDAGQDPAHKAGLEDKETNV